MLAASLARVNKVTTIAQISYNYSVITTITSYPTCLQLYHMDTVNQLTTSHYPRPRGRRVQYLVCVCLSVCYHKIAVNFNYLEI